VVKRAERNGVFLDAEFSVWFIVGQRSLTIVDALKEDAGPVL
jgi:hypothetical protein